MCVRVELMTAESGDLSGHPEFPLYKPISLGLRCSVCICWAVYNAVLIYIRTLLVLMPGISQLMEPIRVIYTLTLWVCLCRYLDRVREAGRSAVVRCLV